MIEYLQFILRIQNDFIYLHYFLQLLPTKKGIWNFFDLIDLHESKSHLEDMWVKGGKEMKF